MVMGWLCREMLRRGIGKRRRLGLAVLAVSLLFLGIILIWKLDLKIPAALIPGKWSDFDFWSRRAGELHDRMGRMGEVYRAEWLGAPYSLRGGPEPVWPVPLGHWAFFCYGDILFPGTGRGKKLFYQM